MYTSDRLKSNKRYRHLQEVEAAIRQGDIYWHALPFNAQLEFGNRQLLQMQTLMVNRLDDHFNVTRKRVASLVPPPLYTPSPPLRLVDHSCALYGNQVIM